MAQSRCNSQFCTAKRKRIMWLLQCCLLALVISSRAAYYHELSMATIHPPEPLKNDSFFGYSISYHGEKLIISAPRADMYGQVFSCDVDKSDTRTCTQMNITSLGTRVDKDKNTHNHDFWLGATVTANKRKLFVCAPRSTDNILLKEGYTDTFFGTNGRCYVAGLSNGNFSNLSQITTQNRTIDYSHRENVTDSFGWSMDVDGDTLRVGSPALAAGRVMTYTNPSPGISPKVFRSPNKNGFNFGYSIASGNFIRSAESTHGVAIGTPYGDYGVGKVLFFNELQQFQLAVEDPAGKVGSLFGAALCAAEISRQTSLLVGAPAHFNGDSYHTGIVYIYRQDNKVMRVFREIEGPNKYGSFFGQAIANVGDVDHDGREEVAIAAPYEDDGRGAVYLYAGSSLVSVEKNIKWIQRFQPESPQFWNLGLSLTANKYTDNGCFDLAIGAPGNDKVAEYHCLTVITVNVVAHFPNLQTRTDKSKFTFDACLKAKYPIKPKHIQAKLRIRVKITHPNATLTNAKASNDYDEYDETLDRSKNIYCRTIPVTTVVSGDYEQEIQFYITAKLLDNPELSTKFDSSRATVSNHSSLSLSAEVRAAECKHEPCEPKLKVGLTTSMSTKSPYVIGATETETVDLVVSNEDGDTAYRPCVRVRIEGDATLTRAPVHCAFVDERQRICQLQRPLKQNSYWKVTDNETIVLGLTSLTSKSSAVSVIAEVFNRCNMDKKADHSQLVNIPLKIDTSGVRIDSKTDEGEIVPFNSNDVRNGKIIYHTYTITNTGGTKWLDLYCDIWMYTRPYIVFNTTFQIYSGDTARRPCELSKHSNSTEFHFVSCPIGDLHRKKAITVVIPMTTRPGALEEVFKKSNGTAKTYLRIKFDESHEREKYETTILTLQEATVPLWVILAAAAVGLLILFLIAFALYECGFLRRQNKEKLEELQRDVNRKSMMLQRQSMRLPESARAELRNRTYRELLDEAEIIEEEEAKEDKEDNDSKPEDAKNPKTRTTTPLDGNCSVSNLDIRAQIEKTLQKQGKKGYDKEPLCKENEI